MRFFLSLLIVLCLMNPCFSFSFKKKKETVPKMVETKQEYEIEAQNVPLKDRKLEVQQEPESDKKNYYPKPHYVFERYNYPPGQRGYDIRFVKKNLVEHPIIVADSECNYVAYANYYYRADIDEIYSDFYVEKLDKTKNKTKRILEFNHRQLKRTPVLLSGFKEEYQHLFSGLSLVDWSADGKKVLIKEQIGSTLRGIYKTNLYVYYVDEEKTVKLSNFNNSITNYYTDISNLNLNSYKYDILPLGFSSSNDDLVVAYCYTYDNDGKKVFLGLWGYNLNEKTTILISKQESSYPISSNGLVLKRVLE